MIQTEFIRGIETDNHHALSTIRYGSCAIKVPTKSIGTLLVEEVLNPFYIF